MCIYTMQLSVKTAFGAAYLLYALKHGLIDNDLLKWTDVLEAIYKVLCKCGVNYCMQLTLHMVL